MEDDFYDGRFIPKGSIVFANIWAMSRDANIFPEPDRFNPDRFLEKVDDETARRRDPRVFVFGFGRRCLAASLCNKAFPPNSPPL
jgi:cytochrome P450